MIDPRKLNSGSLPAALIGNIVTSQVGNRFTQLTLSLAVMVGKKKKVKTLSKFGAVASYDELIRFRTSAAANTNSGSDRTNSQPLQHHSKGLIQSLADNFDCNISSVNGLKQTHSMALMIIQSCEADTNDSEESEKRGHLQCMIWNHTMCHDPPNVDETEFGFDRNEVEESLAPTMLPPGVEVIPPEIRKILCCNCQAENPCGRGNCTCRNANIGCSIFCKCSSLDSCCANPWTTKVDENEDDDEPDHPEEELLIATDD